MVPIQSFAPSILTEIVRRQPASYGKTRFAWQMAVGPALARVTTVELGGAVLTVRCPDQRWSRELVRAEAVILARLQQLLGPDAVERIAITS